MTNTTNRPSISVNDIVMCIETTLHALMDNGGEEMPNDDKAALAYMERRLSGARAILVAELRSATELLEAHGVELPDFPRFSI
jgi:hypothetical protein